MTDAIGCSAGCKRVADDVAQASTLGWECLPITGRWRCPDCTSDLRRVNAPVDNSNCKFANRGPCCVSHCGDPICIAKA